MLETSSAFPVLRGLEFGADENEFAVPWKGLIILRCSCWGGGPAFNPELFMCGETRPTAGPDDGGRGKSGCSCLGGEGFTSSPDTISSTSKL